MLFAVPFVELRVKHVPTKKRSNRLSTMTLEINHFTKPKPRVYTLVVIFSIVILDGDE